MCDRHPYVLIHGYGLLDENRRLIAGSRMSGLTLYTTLLVEGLAPMYDLAFLSGRLHNLGPVDRVLVPGISVYEYDARFPSLLERDGCFLPRLASELYQHRVDDLENPIYKSITHTYEYIVAKKKPDLINAHNMNAICAALHASLHGVNLPPILATVHDIHANQLAFVTQHQDHIAGFVAISRSVAEGLIHAGIASQLVRTISNGLVLKPFLDVNHVQWKDVAQIYGLPEQQAFTILVPARRIPGKGIDIAIRAFDQLALCRQDPMRMLISGADLGESGYEAELRQLADSLHTRDRIHFLPKIAYQDIPKLFRISNVSLLPSTTPEGFGYANIEAMATESAIVITTAHGGSLDYMVDGYNGYLVPPGDVGAIVKVLEQILDIPRDLKKLLKNARTTALEYGVDTMIASYNAFIRDLITSDIS